MVLNCSQFVLKTANSLRKSPRGNQPLHSFFIRTSKFEFRLMVLNCSQFVLKFIEYKQCHC